MTSVLSIVFIVCLALIFVALCIGVAYFVLRRAVKWGIDHSDTAKLFKALANQEISEKYSDNDEEN